MEDEANVKGAAEKRGRVNDERPTHDQLYLADRINDRQGEDLVSRLSLPALQKLNTRYGVSKVTEALRLLHGFPPLELRSAFAYVQGLCEASGENHRGVTPDGAENRSPSLSEPGAGS